jgi:hypothetical protein
MACIFMIHVTMLRTKLASSPCPSIVVSLATFGDRALRINGVVRSLTHDQSLQADLVVVHVAQAPPSFGKYVSRQLNCTIGKKCGNLLVVSGPDYGPATKLLGTLRLFPDLDPESCIITVDDDTIYGPQLVHTLVSRAPDDAALGPSCEQVSWALGIVRYFMPDALWWDNISTRNSWLYPFHQLVACHGWLQGCQGVLYRRKFFLDDVWDMQGMPDGCFYADDVRISGYLWAKGIKRYVYPHYFASDGWSSAHVHLEKNASNSLSLVPDTMRNRQWPCVRYFGDFS